MKKLTFMLAILLIGITSGFAMTLSENYYMVYTGEKLYCKKIQVTDEFIKATLENNQKVVIPTSQIKMYQVDGEIFEKLPVYVNNETTNQQVFMKFIATRAGLKLYKYTVCDKCMAKEVESHEKCTKNEHFAVYRADQFYAALTDKNSETFFEFFGVN